MLRTLLALSLVFLCLGSSCGDAETEADRLSVGAECTSDENCRHGENVELTCLPFKGGYCGLEDCRSNEECPESSACVAHTDGNNYCFRTCTEKSECNSNRSSNVEANCSANVEFVEDDTSRKACVPPSG